MINQKKEHFSRRKNEKLKERGIVEKRNNTFEIKEERERERLKKRGARKIQINDAWKYTS